MINTLTTPITLDEFKNNFTTIIIDKINYIGVGFDKNGNPKTTRNGIRIMITPPRSNQKTARVDIRAIPHRSILDKSDVKRMSCEKTVDLINEAINNKDDVEAMIRESTLSGHHTRAPAKKHSPAVKVNVRKMF